MTGIQCRGIKATVVIKDLACCIEPESFNRSYARWLIYNFERSEQWCCSQTVSYCCTCSGPYIHAYKLSTSRRTYLSEICYRYWMYLNIKYLWKAYTSITKYPSYIWYPLHLVQIAARKATKFSFPKLINSLLMYTITLTKVKKKRKSEFQGTQQQYEVEHRELLKYVCTRQQSIESPSAVSYDIWYTFN